MWVFLTTKKQCSTVRRKCGMHFQYLPWFGSCVDRSGSIGLSVAWAIQLAMFDYGIPFCRLWQRFLGAVRHVRIAFALSHTNFIPVIGIRASAVGFNADKTLTLVYTGHERGRTRNSYPSNFSSSVGSSPDL